MKNHNLGKLLYTAEEAAEVLAIGRTRVFALMASGELLSVAIGKSRRIRGGPREGRRRGPGVTSHCRATNPYPQVHHLRATTWYPSASGFRSAPYSGCTPSVVQGER